MTPNSLLGFDVTCGIRQSFGQALQKANQIRLREKAELMDGHECLVLEAIGIEDAESIHDVRTWIDIERGFRPLAVEIFQNTFFGRKYKPFERIFRRIYDIRLKNIDGIWFPVEGKRDTFTSEKVLPPELEGLTEEQARKRFSEQKLEELIQQIKHVRVPRGPARKCVVDVESIRIKQDIPVEEFVIKFPPGCKVYDEINKTRYTVTDENYTGNATGSVVDVRFSRLKRFAPPALVRMIYPDTLVGSSLPDLGQFRIYFEAEQSKNKTLLLCFWDMQQRPSRYFIKELIRRNDQLEQKGLTVAAIQVSKVDKNTLNEWVKDNNILFPVGMVQDEEEKTMFKWGVKRLPWLILTDKEHIVRVEGFGLNELDEKITTLRKK